MAETTEEKDPRAYGKDLEKVIQILAKHFGRIPTENEVYRTIWGNPHDREWIWNNKGLPENQR